MEARELLKNEDAANAVGTILDDYMTEELVRKWGELVDDVEDAWMKRCMAILYENQMRHLKNMQRRFLGESTTSGNIPDLVKFVFPIIRRVWPNLVANGLCSIQPTSSPIGGIFYWKYLYGTTKGTVTAGEEMILNFDRFYSSEFVNEESIGAGPGTNFTGTLDWKPVKPYGLGQVGVEFLATAVSDSSQKRIYDGDGTGTLTGDTGAASTLTLATGVYDITFSESVTGVIANYYFDMEANGDNVPQVNVDITLEAIKVFSRKLKILWSQEATDDMRAVLNMDLEPELTAGVASQINLGIDRELIMAMYGSGTTNTDVFDAAVPAGRNQVDHYRNIMTTIEKVSGVINQRTHRGPGNFVIIGPSVQPIFGALATHGDLVRVFNAQPPVPAGQGVTGRQGFPLPQAPAGYGVYTMGFLQNKWTVIVDPFFPAGKILVGLKGTMFADSGLVYAPYIPMEMTSAFLDPADWSLRKGVRTRYTKKLVNANFYGIITVQNTP
jgi:hypothetical protein